MTPKIYPFSFDDRLVDEIINEPLEGEGYAQTEEWAVPDHIRFARRWEDIESLPDYGKLMKRYELNPDAAISPLLKLNLLKIKMEVVDNIQDWVIVIDGRTGSGKSSLGAQMALFLNPNFDIKKQAIYTMDEWLNWYDYFKGKRGMVALFDEAMTFFYKRDAQTLENKYSNKILATHRDRCGIYLLCIPSAHNLDKNFRDGDVVKTLIHVVYSITQSGKPNRYIKFYSPSKTNSYLKGFPTRPSFEEPITIIYDDLKKALDEKKHEWQNTLRRDVHKRLGMARKLRERLDEKLEEV
ncbi:MAG: hypothetical protein ACXQS1_02690 [Methermicoccaceae archaeon]